MAKAKQPAVEQPPPDQNPTPEATQPPAGYYRVMPNDIEILDNTIGTVASIPAARRRLVEFRDRLKAVYVPPTPNPAPADAN